MATEGGFPKATGDVLYSSEVNRFATSLRHFTQGSTGWSAGVAAEVVGSTVINAGSLTNPTILTIDWMTSGVAQNTGVNLIIEISGTSAGLVTAQHNENLGLDAPIGGYSRAHLGSPMGGGYLSFFNSQADAAGRISRLKVDNFMPGSTVVIKFTT